MEFDTNNTSGEKPQGNMEISTNYDVVKSPKVMKLSTYIIPENINVASKNLTSQDTKTSEATTKTATKIWTGRVSLDRHQYQNKPQKSDVGQINNSIANSAIDTDEDTLIEAITSGRTWSPTVFNGKRDREHFLEMAALVADFDEGFDSLNEIKERAEAHNLNFSFVHESFSHTPEHPKYRGVFLLSEPITDYEKAKFYCEYIKHVFKDLVDKGAAEPCRLYYGGRKDSLVFQNKGHTLSLSWLEERAEAFRKSIEEEKSSSKTPVKSSLQPKPKDTTKIKESDDINEAGFDESGLLIVNHVKNHEFIVFDSDDYVYVVEEENLVRLLEIKTALEVLDINTCSDYDSWLRIGMALHQEACTNENLSEAMQELFHAWSQKVPEKYDEEDTNQKWESFGERRDGITINTLFHYSHEKIPNINVLAQQIYPLVDDYYSKTVSDLNRFNDDSTAAATISDLDPYYVDESLSGTFDLCMAKLLASQDYKVLGNQFYHWCNTHWQLMDEVEVRAHIASESRKFYRAIKNGGRKYCFSSNNQIKGALEAARSFLYEARETNTSKGLVAFNNGTLNMESGKFTYSHRKQDYLTFKVDGDYRPDASLPVVARQFFESSFGVELIPHLRAIIRMYLDPTMPYGHFLHVMGPSGSGKGTLIRLIMSMFDEMTVGSGNDISCFNSADKVMQHLSGKSIYAFPDMSNYASNCTGFYELVDNGILSGRQLYSSSVISQRWYSRFIVGSVNPIKIGGTSDGWERRVLQLPTKRLQGNRDYNLERQLIDEKAAIISWAIQMPRAEAFSIIKNWRANEEIAASSLEAAIYGDSIKQFLDQCVELTARETDYVSIPELHKHYVEYCKQKGYKPTAINNFTTSIKNDLPLLHQERKSTKDGKIPRRLQYVQMIKGIFGGYGPGSGYNPYLEQEGTYKALVIFDPAEPREDKDAIELRAAILAMDKNRFDKLWVSSIPPQKWKTMLEEFDTAGLDKEQLGFFHNMKNIIAVLKI